MQYRVNLSETPWTENAKVDVIVCENDEVVLTANSQGFLALANSFVRCATGYKTYQKTLSLEPGIELTNESVRVVVKCREKE